MKCPGRDRALTGWRAGRTMTLWLSLLLPPLMMGFLLGMERVEAWVREAPSSASASTRSGRTLGSWLGRGTASVRYKAQGVAEHLVQVVQPDTSADTGAGVSLGGHLDRARTTLVA